MPADIGATGIMGIAFEATPGTYVAPTKYFPIRDENMIVTQDTMWRQPIRGLADIIGSVPGNQTVSGDVEIEALPDVVPWFLHASRNTFVKAGTNPYTYTYTPTHAASIPNAATRTLSVSVLRNGQVFGYSGCVVTKQEWSLDNAMLIVKFTLMGLNEATQAALTPTFANQVPFGAGQYAVEIPTATPVTDTDSFSCTVDDTGNPAFRMQNTRRGPMFIYLGERKVDLSLTRDFLDRTDYDAFKAYTAQSITIKAIQGANAEIDLKFPVAIKDTYEVSLNGQGELLRAAIKYVGVYDTSTSKSYEAKVITTENIT